MTNLHIFLGYLRSWIGASSSRLTRIGVLSIRTAKLVHETRNDTVEMLMNSFDPTHVKIRFKKDLIV